MEAGSIEAVPTEGSVRGKKHLLRSNQVWILLSILGLHKAAPGGWGWWPDSSSRWVQCQHPGPQQLRVQSCSDKWPSYSFRTLGCRKELALLIYDVIGFWGVFPRDFSRWPCEESAKMVPVQHQQQLVQRAWCVFGVQLSQCSQS